jgi:hypothetical protein
LYDENTSTDATSRRNKNPNPLIPFTAIRFPWTPSIDKAVRANSMRSLLHWQVTGKAFSGTMKCIMAGQTR